MKKHTDAHRPDTCALSKCETLVVWMIRNSGWNVLLRKQHIKTSRCHTRTERCCVETEQSNVMLLKQPKISMWFPSQKSCQMAVPMLRMTVTTLRINVTRLRMTVTTSKNVMLLEQHMISELCNGIFCVSFALAPWWISAESPICSDFPVKHDTKSGGESFRSDDCFLNHSGNSVNSVKILQSPNSGLEDCPA